MYTPVCIHTRHISAFFSIPMQIYIFPLFHIVYCVCVSAYMIYIGTRTVPYRARMYVTSARAQHERVIMRVHVLVSAQTANSYTGIVYYVRVY
jgi:hypothetical protein